MNAEEVRPLLLVGAYRDNDVGPDHPLMRKLAAIRQSATPVQNIVLTPLRLAAAWRDAIGAELRERRGARLSAAG